MSEYTYWVASGSPAGYEVTMIVRSDGGWIPPDPANRDYQQYLAWVEEGNVAEEWNPDIIEGEA